MKGKLKIILVLTLSLFIFGSIDIFANETEEDVVCYYKKNCDGELIYVCEDSNSIEPQQNICPPPCSDPKDE